MKRLVASAAFLLVSSGALAARADASSWVFVGGGATTWKQEDASFATRGSMIFDVGVGTSADGPVIVGGLVRLSPIFSQGTDLSFLARGATHGFQAGTFGVALDAGTYLRFWGAKSFGFTGDVALGGPLGLELRVGTMLGSDSATAISGTLGMDLLRLTIYRQSLTDYWANPSPAYTPQKRGATLPRKLSGLQLFL